MKKVYCGILALVVATAGCAGPSVQQRQQDATSAVTALRDGNFDDATKEADLVIERDSGNSQARLVRAISKYRKTMHQFWLDGETTLIGAGHGRLNAHYVKTMLEDTDKVLGEIDADLEVASTETATSLELCLACWKVDWNNNGRIDSRDERLFEIEQDAQGEEIPRGDPRRRPTFRFDHGDILWARAFVAFQRSVVNLALIYDFSNLQNIVDMNRGRFERGLVIKVASRERAQKAKRLFLQGLTFSEESRQAYLAETDDDREWVPNPRQKSHPQPMPVDSALYETWGFVVQDLRRIINGEEGISVREIWDLSEARGEAPPTGYLNVGRMIDDPQDIVDPLAKAERLERAHNLDALFQEVLGDYYVREMPKSPLLSRLARMKREMDRGEESFERKMRYLLWIN